MPRFRYIGETEAEMPTLGRMVQPGDEVEADNLVNGEFVEVPPQTGAPAPSAVPPQPSSRASSPTPPPDPTTEPKGGAD